MFGLVPHILAQDDRRARTHRFGGYPTVDGPQPPVACFLEVSAVINLYYPLVIVLYVISALWQGNLGHW